MNDKTDATTLARQLLDDASGIVEAEPVTGGMSGAAVYRIKRAGYPPCYLKVAAASGADGDSLREEVARTKWLADSSIRVPNILRVAERDGRLAVLTEAMAGIPIEESRLAAPRIAEALARGFAALHKLPPVSCPFDESLCVRLARATQAIAAGAVDPAEFDARNRGVAPATLLRRLIDDRPDEDLVVVHGDATLSNIVIDDSGALGFIDCGTAGRGDRYTDLALLAAEIRDHYGADATEQFVTIYGSRDWDDAKARYYLDLYELF